MTPARSAGRLTPSPEAAFYAHDGLAVTLYDRMTREVPGGDDVAFFRALAAGAPGPVLELGCGTGRIAAALALAGHTTVGLDRSSAMLRLARQKRARLPLEAQRRLSYLAGDMTCFTAVGRFGLVFAAYRTFQSLLEVTDQRRCLDCVWRLLEPDGLLVIDVFDPMLDRFTPEPLPPRVVDHVRHPTSGRVVRVSSLGGRNDPVRQLRTELLHYAELDGDGRVLRAEFRSRTMRWTYRFELHNLLELAGFDVVGEQSDYQGAPPAYGGEIIVTARRRRRRRRA